MRRDGQQHAGADLLADEPLVPAGDDLADADPERSGRELVSEAGKDTREFLDQTRCSYFMKPFNLERLTNAVDVLTGQRSPDTMG